MESSPITTDHHVSIEDNSVDGDIEMPSKNDNNQESSAKIKRVDAVEVTARIGEFGKTIAAQEQALIGESIEESAGKRGLDDDYSIENKEELTCFQPIEHSVLSIDATAEDTAEQPAEQHKFDELNANGSPDTEEDKFSLKLNETESSKGSLEREDEQPDSDHNDCAERVSDVMETQTEVVMEEEAMEIASSLLLDFGDVNDDETVSEDDESWRQITETRKTGRLEEGSESASEVPDTLEPQLKNLTSDEDEPKDDNLLAGKLTAAQHLIEKFKLAKPAQRAHDDRRKMLEKQTTEKEQDVGAPRSLVAHKEKSAKRKTKRPFQLRSSLSDSQRKKETDKCPKPAAKSVKTKGKPEKVPPSARKSHKLGGQALENVSKKSTSQAAAAVKKVYMQKANNLKKPLKKGNAVAANDLAKQPSMVEKSSRIQSKSNVQRVAVKAKKIVNINKDTKTKKIAGTRKSSVTEISVNKDKSMRVSVKIICEKGASSTKMTSRGLVNRVEKAVQICTVRKKLNEASIKEIVALKKANQVTKADDNNPLTIRERNIQRLKELIKKQEQTIERIKNGKDKDDDPITGDLETPNDPINEDDLTINNQIEQNSFKNANTDIANRISNIAIDSASALQNKIIHIQRLPISLSEKAFGPPAILTMQGRKIVGIAKPGTHDHSSTGAMPVLTSIIPPPTVQAAKSILTPSGAGTVEGIGLPKITSVCSLAGVRRPTKGDRKVVDLNNAQGGTAIDNNAAPLNSFLTQSDLIPAASAVTANLLNALQTCKDSIAKNESSVKVPATQTTSTERIDRLKQIISKMKDSESLPSSTEAVEVPKSKHLTSNVNANYKLLISKNTKSSTISATKTTNAGTLKRVTVTPTYQSSYNQSAGTLKVQNQRAELFEDLLKSLMKPSGNTNENSAQSDVSQQPASIVPMCNSTSVIETKTPGNSNSATAVSSQQAITILQQQALLAKLKPSNQAIQGVARDTNNCATASKIHPTYLQHGCVKPERSNVPPGSIDQVKPGLGSTVQVPPGLSSIVQVQPGSLSGLHPVMNMPQIEANDITGASKRSTASLAPQPFTVPQTIQLSKVLLKQVQSSTMASAKLPVGSSVTKSFSAKQDTVLHNGNQKLQRVIIVQTNGKFALLPVQNPSLPGSFLIKVNNNVTPGGIMPLTALASTNPEVPALARHPIRDAPKPESHAASPGDLCALPKLAPIKSTIAPTAEGLGQHSISLNKPTGLRDNAYQANRLTNITPVNRENRNKYLALNSNSFMTSNVAPMNLPDLQVISDNAKTLFATKVPSREDVPRSQYSFAVNLFETERCLDEFDTSPHWLKRASKGTNCLPENLRFNLPESDSEAVFKQLSNQIHTRTRSTADFRLRLGLFENQFCLKSVEEKPWTFLPKGDDSSFLELLGLDSTIDALENSYPVPEEAPAGTDAEPEQAQIGNIADKDLKSIFTPIQTTDARNNEFESSVSSSAETARIIRTNPPCVTTSEATEMVTGSFAGAIEKTETEQMNAKCALKRHFSRDAEAESLPSKKPKQTATAEPEDSKISATSRHSTPIVEVIKSTYTEQNTEKRPDRGLKRDYPKDNEADHSPPKIAGNTESKLSSDSTGRLTHKPHNDSSTEPSSCKIQKLDSPSEEVSGNDTPTMNTKRLPLIEEKSCGESNHSLEGEIKNRRTAMQQRTMGNRDHVREPFVYVKDILL